MRRYLKTLGLIFFVIWVTAGMCTKVITYGTDSRTTPVVKSYSSNIAITLEKARKALDQLGYNVLYVDEANREVVTGWIPTKSDSHYLLLFQRKDYAASDGAYFQIHVEAEEDAGKVSVSVWTEVKSLSGNLSSSYVVENEILKQLDDYMRSPQIIMTNVDVKER